MSYLDFYRKNIAAKDYANDKIKGTCYSMCPEEEIIMREKEKLVHILEVMGSMKTLIKCYSRSAADTTVAVPKLLRPFPVLKDTVHYLLLDVTRRIDVPTSAVYDFINDRLRAIRQDMTIQRLTPEECTVLLEPMVRFHVYYGYKLCYLPLKDYDPELNKKYLLECLKWFLSCCDTMYKTNSDKVDELSNSLFGLNIDNRRWKLSCDRVLMENLYLLCNLDDIHPLYRYLSLPKDIKKKPSLELAYNIAMANLTGNYAVVCRLIEKLCPLTYCALFLYLPQLQRRALQAMSVAYNSKQLTVPTSALCKWLHLSGDAEAKSLCRHYGLTVDGDCVKFNRSMFKCDANLHQPQKQFLREKMFNMKIENIFTYNQHKC